MKEIAQNLQKIKSDIPENVTLVAVSKTKPVEMLQEAYDAGQRIFGENKVQEMVAKWEEMPKDIYWHMIGHLQSNKVKYIVPFVSLIHGVDTLKLLKTIDKEAKKKEKIVDCLLQVHIAKEDTKFGFSEAELLQLFDSQVYRDFKNIRICGLMGMATNTPDKEQVEIEFKGLKELFDKLKKQFFAQDEAFRFLSMGMSGDYKIAIAAGSNMVRVGSAIFGARIYAKNA